MTGSPEAPGPERSLPEAFYLPSGDDSYIPTGAAQGPWDPGLQHGGPPSALLAAAVEEHVGRPGMRVARISVDFLGPVPMGELTVRVKVARPGRRVQLVEAVLLYESRAVAVARAWQHAVAENGAVRHGGTGGEAGERGDERVAGPLGISGSAPALGPSEAPEAVPLADFGYGRALEWRVTSGATDALGPCAVWTRTRIPLITGRPTPGLARMLLSADSANGASLELPLLDWLSMPTSLSLAALRVPEGEWVHMDARTRLSGDGIGLAEAELADADGLLATVTQPLLIERRR